jgi:hypothetical protein
LHGVSQLRVLACSRIKQRQVRKEWAKIIELAYNSKFYRDDEYKLLELGVGGCKRRPVAHRASELARALPNLDESLLMAGENV